MAIAAAAASLVLAALPIISTDGSTGAVGGRRVTVRGVYSVVHGDARLSDETRYFLRTPRRTYRLKFTVEPRLQPQTSVELTGTLIGDTLDLGDLRSVSGAAPIESIAAAPPLATTGTKRVLAILTRWSGASLTTTRTIATNFIFGADPRTVASYYTETSYGQLTWAGAVTPVLTIAAPSQTCDLWGLSNAAEAAATAAGYNLDSYDAFIVDAPLLYCTAAGYGEIGGKHTWVENGLWNLDDGYSRLVPTHEIGHALGLWHSHGLECNAVTVSTACLANDTSNEEYGNAYDVMGNNWPGDSYDAVTWFSAKQEINLGWLTGSKVKNVATSGTYQLAPLEHSGTMAPQVLVITTAKHQYFVEFRQAVGQDSFLTHFPAATNGVHINMRNDLPGNDPGPLALDFNPGSAPNVYDDWFDAPLATGRTFTDVDGGFTLTATATSPTAASVRISFTPKVPGPPSAVTTKPGSGQAALTWLAPTYIGGSAITNYRVSVYNSAGGAATGVTGATSRLVGSAATSYAFTGLANGTTYRFKVAAVNAAGTGTASALSTAVIAGAPAAPTGVNAISAATSGATGSLVVSFTAGANNGSAITSYTTTCSSLNGGVAGVKTGTASPLTVTGVTTAKFYGCSVTAKNTRGTGPSAWSPGVIVGGPKAPTGVSAVKIAAGSLRVSFTAGANNGSAITSYTATCTSSNGGVSKATTAATGPITVTGLTVAKIYRCTVRATNARGPGSLSAPSPAVSA